MYTCIYICMFVNNTKKKKNQPKQNGTRQLDLYLSNENNMFQQPAVKEQGRNPTTKH